MKFGDFRAFLKMIKFGHTVFALPFAYMGMILAAGRCPDARAFFWITAAMVAARTAAMSVNRIVDREIDARNPRTADRALPRGRLRLPAVMGAAVLSIVIFELAAWQLNDFVFALSPAALVFLLGYHYTKRFTWTCHWILGFTDGIAAAGGWAAVRGSLDLPPLILWFAVTVWIAGFDLIYACQDAEVDRRERLHSVPARFGVRTALRLARVNHTLTVAALIGVGVVMPLGWPYWLALAIAAGLLVYENALVREDDLSRVNLAFFNVNGYVSIILLMGTFGGVWLQPTQP